jgi:uncharacterized damage-inducible protein DinB
MTDQEMQYPTGKFNPPVFYTSEDIRNWITTIKELPVRLRKAVTGLTDQQLDTPYRTGGWTLRQVVHHIADSHMNALMRIKWTLTEENPTIKAYEEADWALLADYHMPVDSSLQILDGIHLHMAAIFEGLDDDDWGRTFLHPQSGQTMQLKKLLALYAWHSKHHLAHITETVKKF